MARVLPVVAYGCTAWLTLSTSHAQSLRESVTRALAHAPAIEHSAADTLIAQAEVRTAKSALYPRLSLEASAGPAFRDRTVDGLPAGTGNWLLSRRAGFSLQQLLFDFGTSNRLIESAQLRQIYEELLAAEAMESGSAVVAELYIDILRHRCHSQLHAQRVSQLSEYFSAAEQRAPKEGVTDMTIIRGRLATARADFQQNLSRQNALEARYERLTHLAPVNLKVPAMPALGGTYPTSEGHPKVLAAQRAVQSSQQKVEAVRRDFYPKLFFQAQGGFGRDVSGVEGPDRDLSALAVLRWDAFDGGRKFADLDRAKAEVGKQEAILEEVRLAVEDDVNQAFVDLKGARRRELELRRSVDDLSSGLAKTEEQLRTKKDVRLTTVAGVYQEYFNVKRDLCDAHFDKLKAAYRTLAASGQLLNYLEVRTGGTPASYKTSIRPR